MENPPLTFRLEQRLTPPRWHVVHDCGRAYLASEELIALWLALEAATAPPAAIPPTPAPPLAKKARAA